MPTLSCREFLLDVRRSVGNLGSVVVCKAMLRRYVCTMSITNWMGNFSHKNRPKEGRGVAGQEEKLKCGRGEVKRQNNVWAREMNARGVSRARAQVQ
jgi:hypothetical protein